MSLPALTQGFNLRIKPTEKLVLLALADHANPSRTHPDVYPSVGHLAEKTGYGERTVRRALAGLVAQKVIAVVGKYRGKTTIYRLCYVDNLAVTVTAIEGDAVSVTGDSGHPVTGYRSESPRIPVRVTYESVIEPVNESVNESEVIDLRLVDSGISEEEDQAIRDHIEAAKQAVLRRSS